MIVSAVLLELAVLSAGVPATQDSLPPCRFPTGITVEYGIGRVSLRDEYISKEKYSGTMPGFAGVWSRWHGSHAYRLRLEYAHSDEITNNNVANDVYQFTLNQGFLYQVRRASLLSGDLILFLGPTAEIYVFYNRPQIAVAGFDYAQSFALLLSMGMSTEAIHPLSHRLQVEGGIAATVLSLGLRMVDMEEDDESPAKPLTVFAGTNASVTLGIRYHLTDEFSMKTAYRFRLTRISSWTPLLAASDNLLVALTYGF